MSSSTENPSGSTPGGNFENDTNRSKKPGIAKKSPGTSEERDPSGTRLDNTANGRVRFKSKPSDFQYGE